MNSRKLRPEIERTKKALKQLATARRARLWGQLIAQGHCKPTSANRELFELVFRHAYWTGASDVMAHEVVHEAPQDAVTQVDAPTLPA